jgi:unsaturated chondroitin disaccharide hydrolase
MADYFVSFLPEDYVPYWDLDLSGIDVLRDASAGAIAASGMFLLAELVETKELKEKYMDCAEKITTSLLQNYLFTESKRKKEDGILLHTIYNFNKNRAVDESYPAGDFYFIEAVKKLWDKKKLWVEQL